MIKIINKIFENKFLFILILLCIIFYRSPYILIDGRFQAEEGSFWFRNAFLKGSIYSLFQIFSESGYFNLWANIGSFLSNIPPIEYAPLVTVYLSLLLKLYIFIFILYSKSELFINLKIKYLSCFIILFSPVMTAEVWLNTINSQSYFGILVFLMLFQKSDHTIFRTISPYLIFTAGMTGIYSCALSPLFYLKYLFSKNKKDFTDFISITISLMLQMSLIFYFKISGLMFGSRFEVTLDKILNYFYNVIFKAFFGGNIIQEIFLFINFDYNTYKEIIFFGVSFFLVITLLIIYFIARKDKIFFLILLAFIIESLLILFGSLYPRSVHSRYAVLPGVIIIFLILRLQNISINFILKNIFSFLIFCSLLIGIVEFRYKTKYPELLSCIDCPVWKNEILKWKENNLYKIEIWPYYWKSMYLY